MAARRLTLTKRLAELWPKNGKRTAIQAGPVTIQFQRGKNGKRLTVISKTSKPRYKVLQNHKDKA